MTILPDSVVNPWHGVGYVGDPLVDAEAGHTRRLPGEIGAPYLEEGRWPGAGRQVVWGKRQIVAFACN
jgi:hypothetical protein